MKRWWSLLAVTLAGVTLAFQAVPAVAQAPRDPLQVGQKVVLPGTIQTALGGKLWNPSGESPQMTEVSPGVYALKAAFPEARYGYKGAVRGSWNGAAGDSNIALKTEADNTTVKFVFDSTKKTIVDSINNPELVKAPQTILPRASSSAAPSSTKAVSQAEGSTRLTVNYRRVKGDYDGWNLWVWVAKPNAQDGKAYAFTEKTPFGAKAVIEIPGKHTQFGFIVRKGDWEAKDVDADRFVTVPNSGAAEVFVFQGRKDTEATRAAADAYLAQAAPPRGLPAFLDSADTIRAALDAPTAPSSLEGKASVTIGGKAIKVASVGAGAPPASGSNDSVDPKKVVLPGTIQSALGDADWNPNGDVTRMTEVAPGVFEFVAAFPKGSFEYKIARGGSWAENWGAGFEKEGQNIALAVARDAQIVKFVVNFNTSTVKDSVNNPNDVKAPDSVPPRAASATPKPSNEKVSVVALKLERPLTPDDITKFIELRIGDDLPRTVYARDALNDRPYWYTADDLGSRWTKAATTFKVWTPIAGSVELFLFDNAVDGPTSILDMKRTQNGVWSLSVPGDLHGRYYQYRIKSYNETRVAADINCFAASPDSKRSMVVDLTRTNPQDWGKAKAPSHTHSTDAVLYEMHVRDFTVDPSSGVKPELRGKYLGLTQRGTHVPNAATSGTPGTTGATQKTGLDYLVDLGVTDIHLLPFQNFNPANSGVYNWGYETTLFNVPEEQYSTTPGNPTNTIKDVKTMIHALHSAKLRVVMDVVYNHTLPASGEDSAFDSTVPYYYFRTNDRGDLLNESGVGNAVNDERPMVRKYIRDSLKYWVQEYRVDGFRFDLVGMFSKATVVNLTNELRKLRPDLVLYGEPWTGGGPVRFGKGTQRGTGFAIFNDNIRSAIRGDLDGTRPGFAMGGLTAASALKKGLVGSFAYSSDISDFTESPTETINYVSAHDNLTLWDKVEKTMPDAPLDLRARAVKLSGAIVLLSQGIPFLEGGPEIGRTKGGNRNSYNSGDAINKYDWVRATQFQGVYAYYKGLIAIRKANPALRLSSAADVQRALKFLPDSSLSAAAVGFTLEGVQGPWKRMLVILNGSRNAGDAQLPSGVWNIAANGDKAGLSSLGTASGTLKLEPLSAYVLYQN
jgi:pullulanase